jgi:uncharacterized protein
MICVHCGAAGTGADLYCPSCQRAFIPDRTVEATAPDRTFNPMAPAARSLPLATTQESRTWASLAHLTALAGVLTGGVAAFVGPLVVWLLRRDDPFAREHARQALNFNLSMLVYTVVGAVASVVLVVVTLGLGLLLLLPALAAFVIGYFTMTVVGAVAASRGRPFRYPLALPLVH